jgi:hypothetical protein
MPTSSIVRPMITAPVDMNCSASHASDSSPDLPANIQSWSCSPPSPNPFATDTFAPAMKPSSDIDMLP